jgi:DNA anti-recombination protein RmuC
MTEAAGNESDRTAEERLAALEQRLKQIDDAVVVRVLAVMDVAEELHRQSGEQIDRLTERLEESRRQSNERINQLDERLNQLTGTVDRLAGLVAQSIETANADRAEIRRIWEYLLRQHPNGQG